MNLYLLKTDIRKPVPLACSRRRGSTILLVLAMLSILLLLGIAFSYSTRLESQASFNYAELAQARTSAATGLPMALPMLTQAAQGITTTQQSWNTVPAALQKMAAAGKNSSALSSTEVAALRQAGLPVQKGKSGQSGSAPQANVQVRDLSGLINLNAVDDQAAMERVVSAVLPGADAKIKSSALMTLRGDSPITNASTAAARGVRADDKPADLDPRDPHSQMLDSLARLRIDVNTGQPLFSENEIQQLAKFVTVFSQAPEIYNGPNNVHVPKIPLDSIDPKHVYDTLRAAFPDKKNELLLQFAANVADFSDQDSEPTVLDANGNVAGAAAPGSVETGAGDSSAINESNATIGVEMTPFISEVYPDAATSIAFDDDGQFVELVNPWNRALNLTGWTLRTGDGAIIRLTAQLPPNGRLIITDNFDQPKPDSPPGEGSVVSLFGATTDGSARQVMTQPTFDLADRNSRVSLYNPEGRLADVFTYKSTGQVDGKISFQRADPLVRGSSTAQATPLAPNSGGASDGESRAIATKAWENGNTTMTKVSQLFTLSTGFVESTPGEAVAGTDRVHASQMAELKMPETYNAASTTAQDPYPDNLDLRLIDVFTATPLLEDTAAADGVTTQGINSRQGDDIASNNNRSSSAYQAFQDKMARLRERNRNSGARNQNSDTNAEADETTVPTVFSYGKLNINTSVKYALLGLNLQSVSAGQSGNAAQGGAEAIIEQFEGHRLRQSRQGSPPFMNVSEFVTRFTPNISRGNLTQLDSITDQITVGSSAFEIVATNRLSEKDQKALENKDNTNGPRPATATARWVISMDQEPYSVIGFTLVP